MFFFVVEIHTHTHIWKPQCLSIRTFKSMKLYYSSWEVRGEMRSIQMMEYLFKRKGIRYMRPH